MLAGVKMIAGEPDHKNSKIKPGASGRPPLDTVSDWRGRGRASGTDLQNYAQ
jgi:hypothetical protein